MPLEIEILRHADAHPANGGVFCRDEILGRPPRRRRIAPVVPGNRIHHQRRVARAPRQRPHVVQAVSQRKGAVPAHPPVGRLQPHRTAERGRYPDGAAGIAPHRREDHPRRHRRPGTAARTARNVLRISRVAHRPEVRIGRRDPIGQLVHVQLAHHHRACFRQPFHHRRIRLRHVVLVELRSAGGADAAGQKQVFVCDGNAVQRSAVAPGGQFGIGPRRLRQRQFLRYRQKRVQCRIQPPDARQRFAGQLHRRNAPFAQFCCRLPDGHSPSSAASNVVAGSSSNVSESASGRNTASSASRGRVTLSI